MTQTVRVVEPGQRWPVLRTGERDPIDPHKRRLIYIRDGYSCQWQCGKWVAPDHPAPGRILELDHVIPWSAYGSDRSDNLRALCIACNEKRSNYQELDVPRLLGVVKLCYWCAKRKGELPDHVRGYDVAELGRINVFCGRCSATAWVPDEGWIL